MNDALGILERWQSGNDDKKRKGTHLRLAIVQLCVEDKCLIFQIRWKDRVSPSLREFLLDPNYIFVGVAIDGDLKMLRDECELDCAKAGDIGKVAKQKWPGRWKQNPGLKTLARELTGLEIKKNQTHENNIHVKYSWGVELLLDDQIEYACLDAYASYTIGVKLRGDF